jgi:proline iminopeptidase
MATFEHDGETFWYDVNGTGAPLIVLHGGLGLDHTYLRPAFDQLVTELQVVYLDLRANGRSSGDGVGMTMAQLAADVDALRAHLGLEAAALFGHSYGGFVALEHALAYPDRLTHLLLCDTDTCGPDDGRVVEGVQRLGLDPSILGAFEQPIETHEDLLAVFDVVEPAYFPHSPVGTARVGLAETIYRAEGGAGGEAALAGWDVADRLREITVPTLVLNGTDDFLFPRARAELMHAAIPGARLRIFEASGHLPFVEEQPAFLGAVREFLTD